MPVPASATAPPRPPAAAAPPRRVAPRATTEQLVVLTSLYWLVAANGPFLAAALKGWAPSAPQTWSFALALGAMVAALHVLLLALLATRWNVKPLLAMLVVASAVASHFAQQLGVHLDPSMLRNVLHTDAAEARELMTWSLLPHLLLYAGLPLLLLWRVHIVERRWPHAVRARLVLLLAAAVVLAGSLGMAFQPLASLMRNHKELRYLITPANLAWGLASVAATEARGAAAPRQPIGLDAAPGASWHGRRKPLLVVMVVGETARAANWGLGGYARQTTPQLSRLPVLNFAEVRSCGTNTETSLPCMFAPVGRRDYDEARIRGSESLLHVLARAGVAVHWRDNQSGCKGVCDGLPGDTVQSLAVPGLCSEGRCLDAGLLQGLDERLARAHDTQLLVLHTLGNHGPSYFRRYPASFERFDPACHSDDLQQCTREEIVNAYDNALLYTDQVLAQLITTLQAQAAHVDSAVLYVSDHGESLGEGGLYLHGMPYAVAPAVQTRVPMALWLSDGLRRSQALDASCLRLRAGEPASHDHLFHTLLGLLDVRTTLYEPGWDLLQGCRGAAVAAR